MYQLLFVNLIRFQTKNKKSLVKSRHYKCTHVLSCFQLQIVKRASCGPPHMYSLWKNFKNCFFSKTSWYFLLLTAWQFQPVSGIYNFYEKFISAIVRGGHQQLFYKTSRVIFASILLTYVMTQKWDATLLHHRSNSKLR